MANETLLTAITILQIQHPQLPRGALTTLVKIANQNRRTADELVAIVNYCLDAHNVKTPKLSVEAP